MTKNLKRFFSMVLALSLVFGLVIPTTATKVHAHDHAEEAKQEEKDSEEEPAEEKQQSGRLIKQKQNSDRMNSAGVFI